MTQAMGSVGQARRMQAALVPVLEIGPDFLGGRRDAVAMATTMVDAVQGFVDGERRRAQQDAADEDAGIATTHTPQQLQAALAEVYTCGSGFLADRCDADCVARTMTQIMGEFGAAPSAH